MSPPESTEALCHAYLGLNLMECIFSAWWEYHADFASAMESYNVSCKTLSRSFAYDDSTLMILRVR